MGWRGSDGNACHDRRNLICLHLTGKTSLASHATRTSPCQHTGAISNFVQFVGGLETADAVGAFYVTMAICHGENNGGIRK